MRSRLFLSLIAAAALLVAGSGANAGALTSATWTSTIQGQGVSYMNATATCTDMDLGTVQDMVTCPAGGLSPTGSATSSTYSVSLTVPLFEMSQFTTSGAIPVHTHATLMQTTKAQLVTGNNSTATGVPGVGGIVTVKTAQHTKLSMLAPGASTLVKVPLSVGQSGLMPRTGAFGSTSPGMYGCKTGNCQFTDYFIVLGVLHYITVDFYAWTPHTITLSNLTSKDAPGQPGDMATKVVAKGTFGLTAMGGGTVTLVSPSLVTIVGCPGVVPDCTMTGLADRKSATFTTLKLTYAPTAPEPGTLLLLGAGVAGLVLVGTRKRK